MEESLSETVYNEVSARVKLYREVIENSGCHMEPSQACSSKDPNCPYSDSAFCGWSIRAEHKQITSGALQDAVLRESSLAESLGIPRRLRWLWDIGQRGGGTQRVVSEAQAAVDATPSSCSLLVLSGDTGNGKSVAAGGWAWRKEGRWWPAMRSYWYQPWAPETHWLLVCERLVIDGIQREWASKDGVHVRNLRYIIADRYDNRRKTLITTDCTSSELEDLLGRRYADAMQDDVRFIRLTQASLRDPTNRARARAFAPEACAPHGCATHGFEQDPIPEDPDEFDPEKYGPEEPPFG